MSTLPSLSSHSHFSTLLPLQSHFLHLVEHMQSRVQRRRIREKIPAAKPRAVGRGAVANAIRDAPAWYIVFSKGNGLRLDFLLDARKVRWKNNKGMHIKAAVRLQGTFESGSTLILLQWKSRERIDMGSTEEVRATSKRLRTRFIC